MSKKIFVLFLTIFLVFFSPTFVYSNTMADETKLTYNGMGRVLLNQNMVDGVNVLTQEMLPLDNTIYIIQHDFIVRDIITIPKNCILLFEGGSINKGCLVGQNTVIQAGIQKIFDIDILLSGTWKLLEVYPEWFGAKGDYDAKKHIGTDDSDAISKAINVATSIGVNKVQFTSCWYYINKGVNIGIGSILLQGVQSNLREETSFKDSFGLVKSSSTSLIASPTCSKLIRIGEKVTHPIEIFNIDFSTNNANGIAISMESEFWGPTWPFIIEHCRFAGFNKAIQFCSEFRAYNCSRITIVNNAFRHNKYCVYFADNSTPFVTGASSNSTSTITFEGNTAHENSYIFKGCVGFGHASISNNNIEDTGEWEDNAYEHCIILEAGELAHIKIENNHCENMHKYLLRLKPLNNGVMLDINNNEYTNSGPNIVYNRVDIYEAGNNPVYINTLAVNSLHIHSDAKLALNDYFNIKQLSFPSIYLDDNSKLYISTNYPIRPSEKDGYIAPYAHSTDIVNFDNGKFVGGLLYSKPSCELDLGNIEVDERKLHRYLVYMFETLSPIGRITELFEYKSIVGKSLYSNYYNLGGQKYIYAIHKNKLRSPINVKILKKSSETYIRNVYFKTFCFDKDANICSLLLGINDDNKIADIKVLPSLTGMLPGDKIYLNDDSLRNEFIYNGVKWCEVDGASAGVKRTGYSEQRPIGTDIYVGFEYFDTTLGKPIYARSIQNVAPYAVTWVDAMGKVL